ncbi:MAG TPA: hypothetical protein VMV87_21255 [Burkholderiales bacterium]|nr:hypothetical protein [Burkholderiales bacterium]
MNDSSTNICINDAGTADAVSAPIAATPPTRIFGNPAALDKAQFESRDTRAVGLRASLDALLLMDRLRFVRTLDLAFHLYANRSFTAALAAANNLVKRLVRNGFVTAHTTRVGGMRIYGIAQRGVNFLRDHTGHEGKAHRSLKDVKNPEHRLWANLIVITAEARGLTAMTESEVLAFEHKAGKTVCDEHGKERIIPEKLLTVPNAREPGTRKGLTPDAVLQQGKERIFFEIDTSKRSSQRVSDLLQLVSKVGSPLSDQTHLERVVVFTKERRFYTHITGVFARKAEERIERASSYLKPSTEEGVFDVWYHPSLADDRPGRPAQDFRCGRVQVQMLPDIRDSGEGWYDQDWLPYARRDEQAWPPMPNRKTK